MFKKDICILIHKRNKALAVESMLEGLKRYIGNFESHREKCILLSEARNFSFIKIWLIWYCCQPCLIAFCIYISWILFACGTKVKNSGTFVAGCDCVEQCDDICISHMSGKPSDDISAMDTSDVLVNLEHTSCVIC